MNKHKAPLICVIKSRFYQSPSLKLAKCGLGQKNGRKCKNCKHNMAEFHLKRYEMIISYVERTINEIENMQ